MGQAEACTTYYFPARIIASVTGWSKKTTKREAARSNWPMRVKGNHNEYAPPAEISRLCVERVERDRACGPSPTVRFADLTDDGLQRTKVLLREKAVQSYLERVNGGAGIEFSLSASVTHAHRMALEHGIDDFGVANNTLRRWARCYAQHGLDGLVEQKQGTVGRKSCMDALTDAESDEFSRRGKALAIEHGSGGRPNVARSARELMTHPDIAAPLREHLHGGHASKSYVTPSIRAALKPAPLTTVLAQTGTRAARLSASFTPGDYSNVKAGDVFVSDDMTSNIICWVEWPNAQGWRVGQPQLLPVMDVGSLRWLNFRLILRESGQYNAHDDIWGLFGDVFDLFGLPKDGFLLEGGHWQSDVVKGIRTGLSNEERIGGLSSLGLKIYRAWGPTGKAVIESAFNGLQHAMDAFPGFAGREQRYDGVESVQKQLRLLKTNAGHHPREFFPHISQLADHVQDTMGNLIQERNDGMILRGRSALEKWAEDAPQLAALPDNAKWLYRSAMSIVQVTRNGLRITQGTGKKLLTHYYDNPELLVPRQGSRVVVYWNDHNPEADAVFLTATKPRRYIGLAKYVQPLHRFQATDPQLAEESKRKKAHLHYARTELRSVASELQRPRKLVPTDDQANRIGTEIAGAGLRAEKRAATEMNYERAARKMAARVREMAPEPEEETTLPPRQTVPASGISEEELNEL